MTFDRRQFNDTIAERIAKREREAVPLARMVQAQAMVMESLTTGNMQWDRYLSFLQDLVDKAKAAKEVAQAKQNDPAIWEPYQLAKLKSDILTTDAMIQAWELAMKLPKLLIEDADKARTLIDKWGKDEVAAETGS